ncbi:MAG: TIGR02710 family CRISPR-associated CARF protein [Acidimicrobiales bacterium]|nr:TIGR02710 family CRISPR-associated CARF protein [Acidimicrobiales bacterium]
MSAGTTSVLVVTLGGSPEPIVTSISSLRPNRVVFLATEQSTPQIGQIMTALPYQPLIERRDVKNPDDLDELYRCCVVWLRELLENPQLPPPNREEGADAPATPSLDQDQRLTTPIDVKVDFTGGTKSMAAALAFAAFDIGIPVYLTTAPRVDAVKVTGGERTRQIHLDGMLQQRALSNVVKPQLERFEFDAAAHELGRMVEALGSRVEPWLEKLALLINGLAAWDRFDLDTARDHLKPYKTGVLADWVTLLGKIKAEREWLTDPDQQRAPRPVGVMVGDVFRNAERRAELGRFDDAVARLYRALELAAQSRLLDQFGIRTASFDPTLVADHLSDLPASLEGKTKLGLVDSWTLLAALDTEVANLYLPREEDLKTVLAMRNLSILAHGFTPVGLNEWEKAKALIGELLWGLLAGSGIDPDGVPQLPNQLEVLVAAVDGPSQRGTTSKGDADAVR